ncbi:MAG: hypothetical protein HW421_3092 [Ignavibacteria bacterium]|nr:hypothetical protein [Ignavibacteria bacterium]
MLKMKESISNLDKETLIKYRVSRAKETIKEAQVAIDNRLLFNAENRIYYAIFYIVSALSIKFDFSTSKHKQLMGWFNKNIVHSGKVPVRLNEIYKNALKYRQKGDYEDYVQFEINDVEKHYKDMLYFVSEIEKLIEKE